MWRFTTNKVGVWIFKIAITQLSYIGLVDNTTMHVLHNYELIEKNG